MRNIQLGPCSTFYIVLQCKFLYLIWDGTLYSPFSIRDWHLHWNTRKHSSVGSSCDNMTIMWQCDMTLEETSETKFASINLFRDPVFTFNNLETHIHINLVFSKYSRSKTETFVSLCVLADLRLYSPGQADERVTHLSFFQPRYGCPLSFLELNLLEIK